MTYILSPEIKSCKNDINSWNFLAQIFLHSVLVTEICH